MQPTQSPFTESLRPASAVLREVSPYWGKFLAAFALGDRTVAAARESGLPERVMKIIAAARRYAEGTAVRIEVRQAKDLTAVEALAAIKLAH